MTFENRTSEPRSAIVHVRMSPAERDELNKQAERAGIPAADVIREGIQLWIKRHGKHH